MKFLQKHWKKVVIITVVIVFLIIVSITIWGDAGNHIRHGGRSGGGGSTTRFRHRDFRGQRGSGETSGIMDLIFTILLLGFRFGKITGVIWILALVGLIYWLYVKIIDNSSDLYRPKSSYLPENEVISGSNLDELIAKDEEFNETDFLSHSKEVFIALQNAWTQKDWERVRQFESADLYNQHYLQLQEYVKNKTTNVVEKICIEDAKILQYELKEGYDILLVELSVVLRDYVIDDETKKIIEGDRIEDIYMDYVLEFIRSSDVLTKGKMDKLESQFCPNCGAPLKINASGRCEYCDSIINTGKHSWVLNSIRSK